MSYIKSMQERYTAKMYDSTKKLDAKQIAELKEILRLSPSSINSQPWTFTFVSDSKTKDKLAEAASFNAEKIKNCDTVVVFSRIDNIQRFEKQISDTLPEMAVNYYNYVLKPQPEAVIKAWFDKQVYLSLGIFLGACAEMGIDSTPMEGIEFDKYDEIIGLKDYHTLAAVAIGYRDPEDANHISKTPKSRRPLDEVVKSI